MATLDLQQAAKLCHCHKDTMRELVASGKAPGTKVGRAWVFIEEDLLEFIRSGYANAKRTPVIKATGPRKEVCRKSKTQQESTSEKKVESGGLMSTSKANQEFVDQLRQRVGAKPKNSMTA